MFCRKGFFKAPVQSLLKGGSVTSGSGEKSKRGEEEMEEERRGVD